MQKIKLNIIGLICAYLGATLAIYLHLPLPWLLGPLLISIILGLMQIKTECNIAWRKCGQWIIGTGLGLYFTPLMLHSILLNWPALLLGIVWALLLGAMIAWMQYKLNKLDWPTAWFSSCIGGASEMVNIAERYHAQIDKVAAAHSLRIVLLVVCIPIFLEYFFAADLSAIALLRTHRQSDLINVLLLLLISLMGVWLAIKIKMLNPWVLGPILSVGGLTVFEIHLATLPDFIIHFAQLFIGWSLGSKFPFNFFQSSRKFIFSCIGLNLIGLALSLLMGIYLAEYLLLNAETLILGISPGGIAEMALTAKAMSLAVPVVIAFQLTRLIAVLLSCDFLFKFTSKRLNK